jgi:pyridoxine kinase
MPQVLVVSSQVAFGAVGLRATLQPFDRVGIEAVALPTIVLSNHPAWPRFAGMTMPPSVLHDMALAIEENGWLASFDAVLAGYLPSNEHVSRAAALVQRMRTLNPRLLFICDPIFGDDPRGLYLDARTAARIRDELLPLADVATPNRFELHWLSGLDVRSVEEAVKAARALKPRQIAATSIPHGTGALANVLVAGDGVFVSTVDRLDGVPHGTGDLFAGLLTAKLLAGASPEVALGYAVGGVKNALNVSQGQDRLLLASMDWSNGIITAPVVRHR